MKTNLIPTDQYYEKIISSRDEAQRDKFYMESFITPWKAMMDIMSAQFGGTSNDPFAGARTWGWLLPNQTEKLSDLLEVMKKANAWQLAKESMGKAAARFEPYAENIPFDEFNGWLILADPSHSISYELGYSGATDWFLPQFVCQYWEPSADNLQRLGGIVAHEMHHLVHNRVFPFGPQTSVADYIIVEGMAESFATSIFGEENLGLYVSNTAERDVQTARQLIAKALTHTGFDIIRGYIFGDEIAKASGAKVVGGMPTFGGYAIGYHVVQAFLQNSGKTVEEATFIPSMEIVEQSGYFRSSY